jgi:hypothetical protein
MRTFLAKLWGARRAIVLYSLLLASGWVFGEFIRDVIVPDMPPMNAPAIQMMVMSAIAIFVIAAAIPFVPGAEIGFGLLLVFGASAAPVVYAGMVGALMLSYCIGRVVPNRYLVRFLRWLGLPKAANLASEIHAIEIKNRAEFLSTMLPLTLGKTVLKNRYLVFAVVLNTPGNSVIGGGGGLAAIAGISGLFRVIPFLITVLIAVAPIPLFFWLTNT